MSIVSPPVAAARPVKDLLPGDEPDHKNQPLVSEDRHELDEMPQGVLVLLTQLQPLREVSSKLSLAALRVGGGAEPRVAKASVDQAVQPSVKQPLASSSPAPGDARLALPATRPLATAPARVLAQAPASSVPAMPDRAADVLLKHKALLSATQAKVPVQIPTSAPVQPFAAVLGQAPVVRAPAASDQTAADASVQQKVASSATQLPVAAQALVQAPVASALTAPDQAVADRLVKQETPQALPAQPLPLLDKASHSHHVEKSAAPAKATREPKPAPEASIAKEGKNYLQVPFSKGDAVGLITISKAGAERPEQLLLNPSSALVFSHLSDNLAQAPDPRWRLTDQQGNEPRQGHGQGRADEEAEEERRQVLRDKSEHGGQQT
ncbi:hypothetical protein C1Y33_12475 [Pseudomonas sp. FW305-76]|uniref:SpaN/EivJ family type III secretion system needle length determinant n=2 Tax=Pseudomonas TaxID=286 RepID=UPI000C88BFA6|nr:MULTISPECIES: hypothetical protein [Pseudomonas]PNA80040.1 hypothetical protein C1Y33_12475 [Pseudomonas sp. FW305-76]